MSNTVYFQIYYYYNTVPISQEINVWHFLRFLKLSMMA